MKAPKLRKGRKLSAYDLLTEIATTIKDEPLRVNMNEWRITDSRELAELVRKEFEQIHGTAHAGIPVCKTVACIAGWAVSLTGTKTNDMGFARHAARLLGFDPTQDDELPWLLHDDEAVQSLFYPEEWPDDLKARLNKHRPGTQAYANVVVARIKAFQKEHKAHLESTMITVQ